MTSSKHSRRGFLKKAVAGTAALSVGGVLTTFSAKSYSRIIGANEKITIGIMGVNSRGLALASTFAVQPNCEIISISDVDTRAAEKCIATVEGLQKSKPKADARFPKSTGR